MVECLTLFIIPQLKISKLLDTIPWIKKKRWSESPWYMWLEMHLHVFLTCSLAGLMQTKGSTITLDLQRSAHRLL